MSQQYETAMKIFSDIYGYPKWETNTKDGQNVMEIVKIWEDELKKYTPEQVKQACYKVVKYRKTQTFPTISHLMSELCEEESITDKEDEISKVLKELLNRRPPFDEDVIQRIMWKGYKFKYNNYNPNEDKLLEDEYKEE